MSLRKLVRTVQNHGPFERDAIEALQPLVMSITRQPHEPDFRALWLPPPDALLIDVGADHGQSVLSMHLVGPRAAIVAFEPNARLEAVRTRDSFVFPQTPNFIKIDAPGHESAVLAGAAQTLASARPVVLVEGAWRGPTIAARLGRYGYAHYERQGATRFVGTSQSMRCSHGAQGAAGSDALNSFFITPEMTARGAVCS